MAIGMKQDEKTYFRIYIYHFNEGFSFQSLADHSPKKMMRNMKAYSQLSMTGKLGPFTVNFEKFGELPNTTRECFSTKILRKSSATNLTLQL